MLFLTEHGITSGRAVRIYRTYGQESIAKIKETRISSPTTSGESVSRQPMNSLPAWASIPTAPTGHGPPSSTRSKTLLPRVTSATQSRV